MTEEKVNTEEPENPFMDFTVGMSKKVSQYDASKIINEPNLLLLVEAFLENRDSGRAPKELHLNVTDCIERGIILEDGWNGLTEKPDMTKFRAYLGSIHKFTLGVKIRFPKKSKDWLDPEVLVLADKRKEPKPEIPKAMPEVPGTKPEKKNLKKNPRK